MKKLVDNARTFAQRARARDWDISALVGSQHPTALFISCSDSRVVPAYIADAAPGDLFELRTAGNVVPPHTWTNECGVAATIQFAVSVLNVEHIVVCGHSHCAAVGYAINGADVSHLPRVKELLKQMTFLTGSPLPQGALRHAEAVRRHVLVQLDRVRCYPEVSERVVAGVLSLHGWFYDLATGSVHAWSGEAFEPL